ncbi:MAG: tRNA (adenosine(37)-N6)-dimethylallyltransferase MiaA [Pedosphaera sp.]|nr:tRNA (adenosine(37)-N6)-dimethylallyltransferase MiaA [Pedosphaera sp.]
MDGHPTSPSSGPSFAPVLVVGPTACGKSAVAMELAGRLGGEIISVDSMQVYRGMDIGTAKPRIAEQARVRQHLVDVAELTESFDAARFVKLAQAAVADIQARRRVPILCGGTGLYFGAWLGGLGSAPPADPSLRAELDKTPLESLLEELARRDSVTFYQIDPHNRRRVVRAVEVIRLTGQPFSLQRARWGDIPADLKGRCFGLVRDRSDLHERIAHRVDEMFAGGLVEETKRLLGTGLATNRTALQAIGYRQVAELLGGVRGLRETIELVKVRTRQLAKRQLTWFRGQMDCEWIAVGPCTNTATVADTLMQKLRRKADKKKPGGVL